MTIYTCRRWKPSCQLFLHGAFLLAMNFLPGRYNLSAQATGNSWNPNIVILSMHIRTISPTSYVREIVLLDFTKSQPLPRQFGFALDLFSDDGKRFDRYCGDGIYTTSDSYLHTSAVPYSMIGKTHAANPYIIIDEGFSYKKQLKGIIFIIQHFAQLFNDLSLASCSLIQCFCPNDCICFSCEWGSANWCMDWNTCNTAISLRW